MADEGDEVGRIVIRLVQSEPAERDLYQAYLARPRSRRQEWLRAVLAAGFASLQGAPARAHVVSAVPTVNPVAPQPMRVEAPPSIPLSAATSSTETSLEPEESAAVLKGFFSLPASPNGGQPS